MIRLSARLQALGLGLRSGAANGADSAFEAGVSDPDAKQIFLPWRGFNGHTSPWASVGRDAIEIARKMHPKFHALSPAAVKLMARNSYQVLGPKLDDPVLFVVCWTPDGCETAAERTEATGGTGQAIALADAHGIPVFNMQRKDALTRLRSLLVRLNLIKPAANPAVQGGGG